MHLTDRVHYSGPLTDSSRWDRVVLRPDDVLVVTPAKSGTTWMQTIVALLFTGDPRVETELSIKMPWVDIRIRDIDEVAERLNAMQHRRCMKSHTPMDGHEFDRQVQYLCVFRHPLDVHFSFRKHVCNIPLDVFEAWYPSEDTDGAAFRCFLEGSAAGEDCDAMPLAHILRHYKAAKALADHPNVTLFHYADMTRDLAGVFDRVSTLLEISHPPEVMSRLVQAATFENMKQNAERFAPSGGKGFFRSDSAFFDSGAHGKWREHLGEAQLTAYNAMMDAALSVEDRAWLEYGSQYHPD